MNPVETVLRFMESINERDVDKLAALMTEDHLFVDSLGREMRSREKMRAAWQGFYAMCPDYWVTHDAIFDDGSHVGVFGAAGGTIAENKWRVCAAWLAIVEHGLVKEWRVYADIKPVYDILAKRPKNRSVPVDTVLPHVEYQNLEQAMAWLTKAFGFQEYYRYGDGPSGGQMWAGKGAIQVRQAGRDEKSPAQLGYGTQSLTVFVDDVDAHHARAKAVGAKILEQPHETEYGEYQYAAEDLDGHHWLFSRHAKDRSPSDWGASISRAAPE
jgi:uncharacterized glyoxalase superfamily protein PhnB